MFIIIEPGMQKPRVVYHKRRIHYSQVKSEEGKCHTPRALNFRAIEWKKDVHHAVNGHLSIQRRKRGVGPNNLPMRP